MKFTCAILSLLSLLHFSGADMQKGAKMRGVRSMEAHSLPNADHSQVNPRIVGGTNASPGEYPFFAEGSGCGGSLIWPDIVLSAGHCEGAFANSARIGAYRVGAGESDGSEVIGTKREIVHPEYDSRFKDYMIVVLDEQVSKPNLVPIGLAGSSNSLNPGDDLTVIGVGQLAEQSSAGTPDILQEVVVDFVSRDQCSNIYGNQYDSEFMLCASRPGKDSCYGDSGGPIFKNGYQVGVVSWGTECAHPTDPGVYAGVAAELPWIKRMICENSSFRPNSLCQNQDSSPVPPPTGGPAPSPPSPSPPTPTPPTPTPPSPTPPSPTPPTNNNVEYLLLVQYDSYPEETDVEVYDAETGETVALLPFDSESEENAFVVVDLDLVPGQRYTLLVNDDYGDGIIGGWAAVDLYVNGEFYEELAFVDGDSFGYWDDQSFVVPTSVRKSKTVPQHKTNKKSLCSNTDGTFEVKAGDAPKTCDWLEKYWHRAESLCTFIQVAQTCPSSCGMCDLMG